jgi:hypothetical protein
MGWGGWRRGSGTEQMGEGVGYNLNNININILTKSGQKAHSTVNSLILICAVA